MITDKTSKAHLQHDVDHYIDEARRLRSRAIRQMGQKAWRSIFG